MDTGTVRVLGLAAGLVAVGYVVFKVGGLGASVAKGLGTVGGYVSDGAAVVGTAINPANPENLVNRGVNAAGASITGNPGFTVGGAIYDTVNGGDGSLWGNYKAWVAGFWGSGSQNLPVASYDETERLRKRYPGPVSEAYGSNPVDHFDPMGNYIGTW